MALDTEVFENGVFINCPFDGEYLPLLRALVFAVLHCGFEPRLATERADSGETRIRKIIRLVGECRWSIHDISRIEPQTASSLPRFNMPFELGLDLGCREYGGGRHGSKECLILEKDRYRYQRVLSDLSGNDIRAHDGSVERVVHQVRGWFRVTTGDEQIPGQRLIWYRFNAFMTYLQDALGSQQPVQAEVDDLEMNEFIDYARAWVRANPSSGRPPGGAH